MPLAPKGSLELGNASEDAEDELTGARRRVERRIVKNAKGTIDKPTMIEEPFWPIDTTFSCLAKPGFDIRWVFRALQRVDLRRYNEASGVPSLSRETLRSILLVAPEKDEQTAIRDIIDHADQECTTIRRDIELLQAQKRALMQQLLTGKRRVTL